MLERLYGEGRQLITLSVPSLPQVALEYRRLREITDDIDDARVYGGIHFRFDQEAGARQGTRIARHVVRHRLRSVYAPQRSFECGADDTYWACVLRAIREWKHYR